jgi:hypothetical protein
MAKKSSLVDKALEVSRKNRVPKKPVKTKGKKTVPAVLDWGTGIPEDKLAYLNDDEMALLQAHRMFKGKRSFDGIPAFPDIGDTVAGGSTGLKDGASTKGTTSSGGAGTGKGGDSGAGNSAGDSGGGRSGTGASSSSPSGSQSQDNSKTSTSPSAPSSGPDRGPTGGPARTAPSAAPSGPGGFGPPQSNMPGSPVSTAPSTQSWRGALDRIARGSTVIGNPNNQKQITDRFPQSAPKAVNYSQGPTVSPNMSGPGNYSSLSSITSGANSPFADPGVTSYDAEKERDRAISTAKSIAQGGILGPSVPVGTPISGPSGRFPGSAAYQPSTVTTNALAASTPIGVNPNLYSAPIGPSQSQRLAAEAMKNVFSGPATPAGKLYTDRLPGSEAVPPGDVYKTPGPKMANGFVSEMGRNISGVGNYSQAGAPAVPSGAISIGKNVSGPGNYADARTPVSRSVQPASAGTPTAYGPTVGTVEDPYNQRYAHAAQNIGGIHPVGYGFTPVATNRAPNEVDIPGYPGAQADISPSQGDYSPSQAPAYDTSPSQQSGWTSAQRDAYLGSLGNSKTGQIPVSQNGGQTQGSPVVPAAPMTTLAPMPDWVDYSYLYNDYPQLAMGVNPSIGAFNQYNATFRRGGRVGDSIEAALRLALQGIVSRNKTS